MFDQRTLRGDVSKESVFCSSLRLRGRVRIWSSSIGSSDSWRIWIRCAWIWYVCSVSKTRVDIYFRRRKASPECSLIRAVLHLNKSIIASALRSFDHPQRRKWMNKFPCGGCGVVSKQEIDWKVITNIFFSMPTSSRTARFEVIARKIFWSWTITFSTQY